MYPSKTQEVCFEVTKSSTAEKNDSATGMEIGIELPAMFKR
jgi:hypothetical protein